jgi:cytochrome oxidase Cu insertion factor (SCO1/SenC/PrrC family)
MRNTEIVLTRRFRLRFGLILPALLLLGGAMLAAPSDEILPLNISVGQKAPDFALPSADGKTVRLADFAGHNLLIDFYRGFW